MCAHLKGDINLLNFSGYSFHSTVVSTSAYYATDSRLLIVGELRLDNLGVPYDVNEGPRAQLVVVRERGVLRVYCVGHIMAVTSQTDVPSSFVIFVCMHNILAIKRGKDAGVPSLQCAHIFDPMPIVADYQEPIRRPIHTFWGPDDVRGFRD